MTPIGKSPLPALTTLPTRPAAGGAQAGLTGAVADQKLLQQRLQDVFETSAAPRGPSGTIRYGGMTIQSKGGQLSVNGSTIGTVDRQGNFDVTLDGQRHQGNLKNLPGASFLFAGGMRSDDWRP